MKGSHATFVFMRIKELKNLQWSNSYFFSEDEFFVAQNCFSDIVFKITFQIAAAAAAATEVASLLMETASLKMGVAPLNAFESSHVRNIRLERYFWTG